MPENVLEFSKSRVSVFRISYGITLDDFFAIVEFQNGDCPLCLRKLLADMTVDHDHSFGNGKDTKKLPVAVKRKSVRGILHRHCNIWLGKAEEYPWLISEHVKKYLDDPPAQEVLRRRNELPKVRYRRPPQPKEHRFVNEIEQKWCGRHQDWHPIEAFNPRASRYDGLARYCQESYREYWRKRNRERKNQ
ncbi:MAG TPA: endonuclease domain-containing protein [Nitrospira sp.]|nr:endonuclease domain-containing protein [Nitrospira sp.]